MRKTIQVARGRGKGTGIEKGVRNHCVKYKRCAEVHGWEDRCIPRLRMDCLICSVARTRIVNNGSWHLIFSLSAGK
jgi:hypothetical protein